MSRFGFGEGIQERFKDKNKLVYKISFNGMPSGHVEWRYLGREEVAGGEADVLSINSDTKILEFLNLTSKERVFLDSRSHLPLKVERDIVFFGKKELIEEIYNQDEGWVRISRKNSTVKEDVLYQDTPIRHILALLYFFPENIKFEEDKWLVFNLPTQKVKIKMVSERLLTVGKEKKDTYFLIGRGAKRFSLWLDKENRLPLRLEFILPLGKVIIRRVET